MKIALFHNPVAGNAMLKGSKLVRQLENAGYEVLMCRLREKNGKERFVSQSIERLLPAGTEL
jgi:hypothetical protein